MHRPASPPPLVRPDPADGDDAMRTPAVWSRVAPAWAAALAVGLAPVAAAADHPAAPELPPATAKVMEDWTYALALDAATWGSPLVIMHDLRYNDALCPKPKAAPNAIWRMADISTPKLSEEAGYVTPNVNTVYGFGFLDLGPQPVVLTTPDSLGRFYLIQLVDMWTNAFSYPAGSENGYKGGKFAIVGPGWKGELPPDVKRIDAPTRWLLIQPRINVKNPADLAGAKKVLDQVTVQGLAEYLGKPAPSAPRYDYQVPKFTDAKQPVSAMSYTDPLQFWDILSESLNENPPPQDQVTGLLPAYKPLGIELGKRWDRTKVHPVTLKAMKRAAEDIGPMLSNLPVGNFVNGWFLPPPTIGNFGTDYKTRAVTARVGLTANTPREAIYLFSRWATDGKQLTGDGKYTVTFKETPPFVKPGFWSLTMYDGRNNYTVPNPIDRYSLGSADPLKKNADGSVTIHLQKDRPAADKESNWLPAPAGPYYVILRAYSPGQPMIESLTSPEAYTPQAIEPAK
jgi:hypothetical protein